MRFGKISIMPSQKLSEAAIANPGSISRDGEALLFNAAVRALSAMRYSDLEFDIGGKKSRRRFVRATASSGQRCSIWIKSTVPWVGMADVVLGSHGANARSMVMIWMPFCTLSRIGLDVARPIFGDYRKRNHGAARSSASFLFG